MSAENTGGNAPVATATPGSPIHVNVQVPASEKAAEQPDRVSRKSKTDRQAKEEADFREKGARSVLKGLGIPKEEREGLLKEIRETRSAKALQEKLTGEHKSRAEKAEAELKLLKAQAETYEALAKTYADEQFATLPEALQKFIAATAGDSLDARLKAIKTAKESGLITVKEAAAATAQAKSEEKPARPANTSNAVNPKAAPAVANISPRQQWEQLKAQAEAADPGTKRGLIAIAAQFYHANARAIDNDWT